MNILDLQPWGHHCRDNLTEPMGDNTGMPTHAYRAGPTRNTASPLGSTVAKKAAWLCGPLSATLPTTINHPGNGSTPIYCLWTFKFLSFQKDFLSLEI